ncbi:amidohydrolase family protein [Novosphingobium profundi]|uniref:amidohydrolase family protein n=1 Tax=Novosphingobium profundi TaxID=1774954 RepID=UPI001BD99D47|nr:amidohydrolase family protein [Novosphingobium profundi]MBT0670953.1 amidohydrolase family protein [Novosphingobium profundi]
MKIPFLRSHRVALPVFAASLAVALVPTLTSTAIASAPDTGAGAPIPLNDRHEWIAPGTPVTADPRRVPVKPRPAAGKQTVLVGGTLFDARKASLRPATVVIEDDHVAAVLAPGAHDWEADATVIDVTGKTVMPGLIDMHTHIAYPDGDTPIDEQADASASTLRGVRNMRWFIASGITSVRDLNGPGNTTYMLAEASQDDTIAGPRVFTAGHLITGTGGHATERPFRPSHGPDYAWEADGAEQWREAVRRTFKLGASVIKVGSHFAPDEIKAAVDEAHRLGLKVTCHCETMYIPMAVDAGIDMIEHPLPRTDATIADMARHHTASIPTLQVYQNVLDRNGGYYGTTSGRFNLTSQGIFDVFKRQKAAGIVMGVGTDTIGDANKMIPNVYIAELKWFVKGGYTIPQALQAATWTNAQLLDMADRLGTIEPGKLADVIVIDGNPAADLDALRKVSLVFKGGHLEAEDGAVIWAVREPKPLLKPSPPADVN